jgi:hypothetical protein
MMDGAARKTPTNLASDWLLSASQGQNHVRTQGSRKKAIVGQTEVKPKDGS